MEEAKLTTRKLRSIAGRKGGLANVEKYGTAYFCEIGHKGGKTTKERHGLAHYSKISKGGNATRQKNKELKGGEA